MKIKLLLLIAITFNLYKSVAQLSATEEKYLADIMTKKINALRKKVGTQSLQRDENLAKAASFHAKYMSNKYKVTHYQLKTEFKTPQKRVRKFSNDFNTIGENVLNTRSIKPPFTKRKLSLLANLMYKSWKNSPGHYKNMISSKFSHGDFGFSYHKKKKQIFAAHVFGLKKHIVTNQLTKNSFGIKEEYINCTSLQNYDNILVNMGNSIYIKGDEILFKYHNKEFLNKIFTNNNDGIAIDLIIKDQMHNVVFQIN